MNFSIAVIASLLLYLHRVIFSTGSVLSDTTLLNGENILEQFFAETKLIFEKYDPRHVTIVGASTDQLRQTKPLLKAFPYFVSRDMKGFCESREFVSHSLIVYFLDSLTKEYLRKAVEGLLNCKKNRIISIYEGMAAVNEVDIDSVLRIAFEEITAVPIFLHHTEKSLKIYIYQITPDCSRKFEMLVDWMPGFDVGMLAKNWFDMKGCPVSVGTKHNPPWMNLAEDANGVVKIISGAEGHLISTIAQKLNFTPLVQIFDSSHEETNLSIKAMVSSCADGNTDIGIAQIRPTEKVIRSVDISQTYFQQQTVWCVPRIPRSKSNIMTSEFTWKTWVLIGLTFLVGFGIEKIVRNSRHLNRGNANRPDSSGIVLDLIGSTIGNPIIYRPFSIGGKAMLIIYICYSTVITTAYKTSLSSILTAENSESSIVDVEGIIKANLTTGGDKLKLGILMEQKGENDLTMELIKRYEIETNVSNAMRRVSYEKNFAYLTTASDLAYHSYLLAKSGMHTSYEVLSEHVLPHSNVMIFKKSLHIAKKINNVVQRLSESGLLQYWMDNDSMRRRVDFELAHSSKLMNAEKELHKFTKNKFRYIFIVYCLAMIFCILVFLGELIVHKFNLANRFSRHNHIRRF